jgi:hypothetical protein
MAEERAERVQEFYFSPTLIIGLGGTGQEVVRKVKRRLHEAYGDIPIIRYLAVDTDFKVTKNPEGKEPLDDEERVYIGGFDPSKVIRDLDGYPSIKAWWPPSLSPEVIPPGKMTAGTFNQMRCAGRLALFVKYSEFINKLRDAINVISQIESHQKTEKLGKDLGRNYIVTTEQTNIFIIFSVCGGTGGGIFLDVAYLCRDLIAPQPKIQAMVILPPVLETFPTIREYGDIRKKIMFNSYAALKELDHFNTVAGWVCKYPLGAQVEVDHPPFNFIYLIDLSNQERKSLNSVDDICEMIANAIFLRTGLPTESEIESIDAITSIRYAEIRGKSRAYSSLATTSLIFPKQRVLDYCSARMAEALIRDGFLQGSVESEVRIRRGEVEQAVSAFLGEAELRDKDVVAKLRENRGILVATEPAIRKSEDVAKALRQLVAQESVNRNQRQEQADLIKEKAESLQAEAKEALGSRVVEVVKGRGIHFATLFLEELIAQPRPGEVDRATISLVGLKRRVEGRGGTSERALAEAERSYNKAKARLKALEAKWWGRVIKFVLKLLFMWRRTLRGRIASCITYMKEANERFLDLEAQGRARDFYDTLIEEARRLHSSLAQLRQRLKVAATNLSAEAKEELMPPSPEEGIYELAKEVVDADYIQRYYEEKVASIDIPTAFREFTKGLPDVKVAQLEIRREKEYARLLKEHASGYFGEGLERINVLDILSEGPPEEVERRIEKEFQDLLEYCGPFLRYEKEGLREQPQPMSIHVIGAKDKDDPRIPGRYRNETISTGLRHRIDAIRILHGLPAFLIMGMDDYKNCYDEKLKEGKYPLHISRGWERFEDIFPEVEKVKVARDVFAMALAFDFIVHIGTWFYFDPERKYKELNVRPPAGNRLAQGREKAEDAFIERDEMVEEAGRLIEDEIVRRGNEAIIAFLDEKIAENERKIAEHPTSSLRPFWEREIEAFKRNQRALGKIMD